MGLWIRRLKVENVAGVESAEIDFDAGLNVCYGPNELGKSTLVKAIRAALLLQHGSSATRQLQDWHVDAAPTVELVFETEPQQIWRVRKSFGSGRAGASYLDFSKDGTSFTVDCKGREVDDRLQGLLQWGIAAPGGKGKKKQGLPESFISTALLGEQSDLTAILDRALDEDSDDTGRRHLTQALQAIAEHPVFGAVFKASQAKFDEAFTATGRRKTGAGSVWRRLQEQVQDAADRLREVKRLQEDSLLVRDRVEALQQQLLEAQALSVEAEENKKRVDEGFASQQARANLEASLANAAAQLQRIEDMAAEVAAIEAAIAAKGEEQEALGQQLGEREQLAQEAKAAVAAAEAEVWELESGTGEQQRRIREQELQNELLTLESRVSSLKTQLDLARRIEKSVTRAAELESEIESVEASHAEAREVLEAAQNSFAADEARLEALQLHLLVVRWLAAKTELETLEQADAAAADHATQAKALTKQAKALRKELAGWHAPTQETLNSLRALETERRVAEEKLHVGITAMIVPLKATKLEVGVDGEAAATRNIPAKGDLIEAQSELTLDIPGFGQVALRGGSRDLVEAAEAAKANWVSATTDIFEATGCDDLVDLEALLARSLEKEKQAEELEREAEAANSRAEGSEARDQSIEAARNRLKARESALIARVPEAVGREELIAGVRASELSEHEIDTEINEVQGLISSRRDLASQLENNVARDAGNLEAKENELAGVVPVRDEAIDQFEGDWASGLKAIPDELDTLEAQNESVKVQLSTVGEEATNEVDDARVALGLANDELEAADNATKEFASTIASVTNAVAQLQGELGAKRKALAAEDDAGARTQVEELQAQLSATPAPEHPFDEEDARQANETLRLATSAVTRVQLEIREAEGALAQTGGQFAEERAEQAQEALEAATAQEHEVDLDYKAWGLLRDTLKEAEAEDSVHLGNVLVEPISERMGVLTGGRYGKVDIEPELTTTGIELGGESRDHESLSVGTREQLALVLRLAIAEVLKSFLIMDDQFTHSDPERVSRIREVLQAVSGEVQVIVFTCHPDVYLVGQGGSGQRDVDLSGCLRRQVVGGGGDDPESKVTRPSKDVASTTADEVVTTASDDGVPASVGNGGDEAETSHIDESSVNNDA